MSRKKDVGRADALMLAKIYPGEDPESLPAPGVRITIEVIEDCA